MSVECTSAAPMKRLICVSTPALAELIAHDTATTRHADNHTAPVMSSERVRLPASVLSASRQIGCIETVHATTHSDPTYLVGDIVHYGVANMPGAVPRTSTFALTNATLPFVKDLANYGWREALSRDPHLANGLNVHAGHVNHEAVAHDLGYEYLSASDALKAA